MPSITDQRAIRECRKLPFCYLCGKPFERGSKQTRDHVPPRAIFTADDRQTNPLILPVHCQCNQEQSVGDEVIGQLVSVLHTGCPDPENSKLKVGAIINDSDRPPLAFLIGHDLRPIIWRIVKGCHAALYREPLIVGGRLNVHMPFPEGKRLPNRRVSFDAILPQQEVIAGEIKKNRLAKHLDRVVCFNGKCVYECVWASDDGGPLCMFALRLYDWEKLADRHNFPARGCVGYYSPTSGKPATATWGTPLVLPTTGNPLDPFEDSQEGS